MSNDVLCLRPEADFARAGALPPSSIKVAYKAPDDAEIVRLINEANALVIPAVGPKLAPGLFEGAGLKLVQVTGAGVDRLDKPALERLSIPVANVPGGSNGALAEYTTATASMLLRRFGWADAEIKAGRYVDFRARMVKENIAGIEDLLVGVVGFGTIGVAVARAFHARGARIAYYDPNPPDAAPAKEMDAESMSLDDLLASSDVVTLHVPLLPATRDLIGERELALMKPEAVLIQAARGGVVNEAALAACLQEGRIAGAAVDVYSTEPPPADNPLFALKGEALSRVLFTPHIAGVTRQSAAFLFRAAWQNVERVLVQGEPPLNRVY